MNAEEIMMLKKKALYNSLESKNFFKLSIGKKKHFKIVFS